MYILANKSVRPCIAIRSSACSLPAFEKVRMRSCAFVVEVCLFPQMGRKRILIWPRSWDWCAPLFVCDPNVDVSTAPRKTAVSGQIQWLQACIDR
jgi:hypothetical protein